MKKDLTFTIERPEIFLQVTYECDIHRIRTSDQPERSWWQPDADCTIVKVDATDRDDVETEWFYGDVQPRIIARALELYEDRLNDMLQSRLMEIVNDPNFQD